ncbi:MAG: replication-associated recombination protein A [Clostridiales bacterium]|nr:replication-associated recombination protein A [Clostridiales bacterium]
MENKEPLAYRMRPKTLDEFVGQDKIVGKGKLLYRMIKNDRVSSIILYGPPGTGKTSLARIIANSTKAQFKKLNAVSASIGDIRKIVEPQNNYTIGESTKTVVFIDEIHRFNKTQQDVLLPYVESGKIVLVGATTENPFYEVNKALISRSTVFMLEPLTKDNIITVLNNAITNKENGYGNFNISVDNKVIEFLGDVCNGDSRVALNALELAVNTGKIDKDGKIKIGLDDIKECVQQKTISFDKNGDSHYDNISAFIKSMRGSDPDAAVFYLARALYAGEDINFLARRIIICASEDVGMANPNALCVAVAAANAVKMIGMPEARIILSHAAIMVATSPKSNSCYMAINKALSDVSTKNTGDVPLKLRNATVDGLDKLGYGKGYKYAHDYPNNLVRDVFLPSCMEGTIYYNPTQNGYEAKINEWLMKYRP